MHTRTSLTHLELSKYINLSSHHDLSYTAYLLKNHKFFDTIHLINIPDITTHVPVEKIFLYTPHPVGVDLSEEDNKQANNRS